MILSYFIHRYTASGNGMKIVVFNLLLTFLTLRIKSPTLPTDKNCFANWFGEILSGFMALVCLFCFSQVLNGYLGMLRFIFHFILRVLFPLFYIYNFPALYQYVLDIFKGLLITKYVTQVLSSCKRSPQINVIE